MRISSRALVLVAAIVGSLAGLSGYASAQAPFQPACQNPQARHIEIFYVNGVTTSLDEARINAGKLEQEFVNQIGSMPAALQAVCYDFRFNYNPTHGELKDFAEASQQRFGLDPTKFWETLESFTVVNNLLPFLKGPMTDANQIDAATIQRHAARYRETILPPSCRSVLIVPHSQGNLYTNAAFDQTFATAPVPPAGTLKVVGVATPASLVSGNGRYRSSSGDLLINTIRLTLPTTSVANTDWGPTLLNILTPQYSGGHSFIGYLSFNPSRTDIFNDIRASLTELLATNPCP
ncbi:MAG: hypothetical protein U0172_04575 [Nitrospiraceae bacterium]